MISRYAHCLCHSVECRGWKDSCIPVSFWMHLVSSGLTAVLWWQYASLLDGSSYLLAHDDASMAVCFSSGCVWLAPDLPLCFHGSIILLSHKIISVQGLLLMALLSGLFLVLNLSSSEWFPLLYLKFWYNYLFFYAIFVWAFIINSKSLNGYLGAASETQRNFTHS